MENNCGLSQDDFRVGDTPIICDDFTVNSVADFINNKISKNLPMVYVSKSNKTKVNCDSLAKWLSGMAYVVVEKDIETSYKLKELTGSKNVHSGAIGIYYSDSENHQSYTVHNFRYGKLESSIALIVQQTLINHMSSDEYTWSKIQLLKTKEKARLSENISKDFKEYMDMADEVEKDLQEKVDSLIAENNSLSAQLEAFKYRNMGGDIRLNTSLDDFCMDEQRDFVIYLLNEVFKRSVPSDSKRMRRYEILENLVKENTVSGENDRIVSEVKRAFKNPDANIKNKLKKIGFNVEDGGQHIKLTYGDSKYMFTMASTPSDIRSLKNLRSDIENGISISKKML